MASIQFLVSLVSHMCIVAAQDRTEAEMYPKKVVTFWGGPAAPEPTCQTFLEHCADCRPDRPGTPSNRRSESPGVAIVGNADGL